MGRLRLLSDLRNIHMLWKQALRKAVQELPLIQF
jgi:hypothetical protein